MELTRRALLVAGTSGAVLLAADPAEAAPRVGKVLAKNLRVPWGVAFLPNGDALVSERTTARIRLVRRRGGSIVIGQVPRVARNAGEGGLLGLAVSPTFASDRWVYIYHSTGSDNRIVRMRYADGRLSHRQVVLAGIPVSPVHNGGRLLFSPNGLLYATTGDAADSSVAQSKRSLGGKILRLTPEGDVPAGNPFRNFTWSYGHRNPQGLAFDARGSLWSSELGAGIRDELNLIKRGHNYGWPRVEGGDGRGPLTDPLVTWPTSQASPSGLAITKNRAWVGALRGEALLSVVLSGSHRKHKARYLHHRFGRIRTVQLAPDGALWITTSNRDGRGDPATLDDRVIRIHV